MEVPPMRFVCNAFINKCQSFESTTPAGLSRKFFNTQHLCAVHDFFTTQVEYAHHHVVKWRLERRNKGAISGGQCASAKMLCKTVVSCTAHKACTSAVFASQLFVLVSRDLTLDYLHILIYCNMYMHDHACIGPLHATKCGIFNVPTTCWTKQRTSTSHTLRTS